MAKGSSNSRNQLLTSSKGTASLCSDQGPSKASWQLPPIHFSPCSRWRAARRNKLETKENHGHPSWLHMQPWLWVPGRRASRNRRTHPDLLIGQLSVLPREPLGTDCAGTEKMYSLAGWRALQSYICEIQWGQTGCSWTAGVTFLSRAMGFKVNSSKLHLETNSGEFPLPSFLTVFPTVQNTNHSDYLLHFLGAPGTVHVLSEHYVIEFTQHPVRWPLLLAPSSG